MPKWFQQAIDFGAPGIRSGRGGSAGGGGAGSHPSSCTAPGRAGSRPSTAGGASQMLQFRRWGHRRPRRLQGALDGLYDQLRFGFQAEGAQRAFQRGGHIALLEQRLGQLRNSCVTISFIA